MIEEYVKWGAIIIGSLIVGYVAIRMFSSALFRSWFEMKHLFIKKEEDKDADVK